MQFLLVTKLLHLSLKALLALDKLALVGMLGYENCLLLLVLHRVVVLLVALKFGLLHAAPPDVLVQTDLALKGEVPRVDLLDVGSKSTLGGECLVAGEGVLLKVPGGRSPGAGVADAEVDRLLVSLHFAGLLKALAAVRALVRARHLMDRLNVLVEAVLPTKGFSAGGTLVVLNLGVNSSYVAHHIRWLCEDLIADGAFVGDIGGLLPVAVWKTEPVLMIHKSLPIAEDFLASLADQLPVVLGELDAACGACVLVYEHAGLGAEERVTSRALPGLFLVIFFSLEEVELGNVDAELLGVFLAVVD